MYQEIKSELRNLKLTNFSGHIKFGVEKGKVVSLTITTKKELNPYQLKNRDFDGQLLKLHDDNFYGAIDYNLENGEVESFNWQSTFQGDKLKEHLEAIKCKGVKVVVKKLST